MIARITTGKDIYGALAYNQVGEGKRRAWKGTNIEYYPGTGGWPF